MTGEQRKQQRKLENEQYRKWKGSYRPYDLIKEATIAIGVVLALAFVLSILFSSPDDPPATLKTWSRAMPVDFVTAAVSQLDGTSETATYGPPYNHAADGQHIAFVYPAKWVGVNDPVNTVQDYVVNPLRSIPGMPTVQAAVSTYLAAPAKLQTAWTTAYSNALNKATANPNGSITVPAGHYGPVPTMMNALLSVAQSGALDGALLTTKQFYETDYTKILLFLEDGNYLADRAQADHLLGNPQWGMMNETGSFPGQVWLWLYTFWYQVSPFSWSNNADLLVMMVMTVLSIGLVCIPFLPGIRDIPRKVPIYKAIWRDHYRSLRAEPLPPEKGEPPRVPTPASSPPT